jgi:hypothetical protein
MSWLPESIEPAIRNTARTTYHPPRLPIIPPRHTATSPLFRGEPEIPFRGDLLIPKVGNMSKCQLKAVYGVYGCMVLRDSMRFPFRGDLEIFKSWQLVKTFQLKGDVGYV